MAVRMTMRPWQKKRFDDYYNYVVVWNRTHGGDEDTLQEYLQTLVYCAQKWKANHKASFTTYLYRSLQFKKMQMHKYATRQRRGTYTVFSQYEIASSRHIAYNLKLELALTSKEEPAYYVNEAKVLVDRLAMYLPYDSWLVLRRYYIDGWTQESIAKEYKCSRQGAAGIISRALDRAKSVMRRLAPKGMADGI